MEAIQPYLPWIVQAVSGLIGGGLVGSVLKGKSLGGLGNVLAGVIGGLGAAKGLDAAGLMGSLQGLVGGNELAADGIAGLIGGGVLQAIAGMILGGKGKKAAA
jgi:hypothetical protein